RTLRIARRRLPAASDAVLDRSLRPVDGHARLERGGALPGSGARLRQRPPDGGALGPLLLLRVDRAGLVRVWLGDPAPRDRVSRHLPLPALRRPSVPAAAGARAGDLAV